MNNYLARMNFNQARRAVNTAFAGDRNTDNSPVTWKQFKLTQSYLRLELPLVTTSTLYQFNLLVNEAGANNLIFNTERRLRLQDSFVPSEIGFFIGVPSGSTDTTWRLLTYPSPTVVTAANVPVLTTIWNGDLSVTVNNNVLIPAWDLWRHYFAPITQQTAAIGAGSPIDEFRGAVDAMYPMEPNVVMIGSKSTQLQVTLKTALTAVPANSRMVLFMRGVLVQNSTSVS